MDKIETIEGSVVQHGRINDRIYLMHLHGETSEILISKLDTLALENRYGKIFAKIPATFWTAFKSAGYITEAVIPKFFRGTTDGLFIAKFFSADRQKAGQPLDVDRMESSMARSASHTDRSAPPIVACTPADAEALAKIYQQAFESYPFPIHQPEYLKRMMSKNTFYFGIDVKKKTIAVAAAEIDSVNQTCEMTDFATLPEYRGHGLARKLLGRLEDEALHHGVKTAYTIARADSPGMNRVFQKMAYRYAGQLIKNSQIGGRIRSMTVWYKHL